MKKSSENIYVQNLEDASRVLVYKDDDVYKGDIIAEKNDRSKIYAKKSGKIVEIKSEEIIIDCELKNEILTDTQKEINISEKPKRNIDALDGIRTFAILGVIFYHLNVFCFKGGLIGVTVFFVLSGYLITGLLVKEISSSGTINLKNFWIRRIRRLFPAICVVIVCVGILCIFFEHFLLTKMKPDIIPSLFWFQNWWYVFRGISYFDSLGAPSPLVHFWSLAIEEQFYIFWPLILLCIYKLGANNKTARRICIILAVISALLMFFMFDPNSDPTRVYYGTDTRAFSLLLGAWLAYLLPVHKADKISDFSEKLNIGNEKFTKCINVVGIASAVILLLTMVFIEGTSPLMYRGVLFIVSILTVVLIFSAIMPNCIISKLFSVRPLTWIGKRSYGMYLWHYPIILLLKSWFNIDKANLFIIVFTLILTICISALQYKFIEEPIRAGKLSIIFRELKKRKFVLKSKEILLTIISALLIVVFILGVVFVPDEYYVPEEEINSTGTAEEHATVVQKVYEPLLVGDSVPGSLLIEKCFPHGLNDSVVSRWTYQGTNVLREYLAQGALGNIVVIACFNNHPLAPNDLDDIYSVLGKDRQIFFVNCYAPLDFCLFNNDLINKYAETHNNVHVIDWYSKCSINPDNYTYKDHIHLNRNGQVAYTEMIAQAINPFLADDYKCSIANINAVYSL